MAYIGKQPVVGNFQVCDAISVVNGQAAYTMQVGSTNVEPENANHMLVSLNGVLQKPGSSFTISGATITFASNLATGDVIDFIILLGDTLNVGTPSDDSVGAAQIKNDLISGTTALTSTPDDTDEFLVSDAGTIKRIDYSLIKGGGDCIKLATGTASGQASISIDGYFTTDYNIYKLYIMGMHHSSTGQDAFMRVNQSGTAKTDSSYAHAWRYQGVTSSNSVNSGDIKQWAGDSIGITNNQSGSIQYPHHLEITVFDPLATDTEKMVSFHNIGNYNNNDGFLNQIGGGTYRGNTNAISGFTFFAGGSQTTTMSHWVLYGFKI